MHRRYQYSNRNCYEKLELDVSNLESATSIFLIATKSHLFEPENAQLWCISLSHATKERTMTTPMLPLGEPRPVAQMRLSASSIQGNCAGRASKTAIPTGVGTTRFRRKPALEKSSPYSSGVRSFPPVMISMVTSANLPGDGSFAPDKPHSTSSNAPSAGTARRQFERICRAFSSSQSWMMLFMTYARVPAGTARKKSHSII